MNRAYSAIEIRAVDDEKRIIEGIASTPVADRMGDVVDPMGAEFKLPIPLLFQHDSGHPIGHVIKATVTKAGIKITAQIAKGVLPKIDEAWALIKSGLVRGLSIGFRPTQDPEPIKGTYGVTFKKWEWLELSAVTIAANSEASILQIKSADQAALRAAHGATGAQSGGRFAGNGYPDASGNSQTRKGIAMKTLQQLMEERTQKSARMTELIELRSVEDRKFTADEATEFDTLDTEVGELDDDIRIKRFEERQVAAATRVKGMNSNEASASRSGISFVRKQDPDDKFKGQSFTRTLIAKALSMQYGESPAYIAEKRWGKTNPNLVNFIKATVAGGGTGSGEWGAELADSDARFTGDFVEFLYGLTVFDRLNLRSIPSRVHVKGQDGAFTGYWTGESKAIAMSKGDFSDVELTPLKVAALTVISVELLEDSQPSAEMIVRDGLAEASAQRLDTTFLSAAAASAGVSPAGILNGVTALTPSGTNLAAVRDDLTSLLYPFVSNKMATGITLVMNPATALALSMFYGALDQLAFPDINESGGQLNRRPVVVGDNVTPGDVIAIRTQDVWKIGDSGIQVSMSREATIEQRDDPTGATDTPTGMTTTGMTNMFQEDSIAFKVTRRINYQKRRTAAVQYLSNVEWGAVVS